MYLYCVRAANTVPIKTCDKCIFYGGLVFGGGVKCSYRRQLGVKVTEEASRDHFLGATIVDLIGGK